MSTVATDQRALTPPAVARRLAIGVHRVLSWIAAGELVAFNTGTNGKRPRWKVFEADLAMFLASRRSQAAPKPAKRKRTKVEVIEFF